MGTKTFQFVMDEKAHKQLKFRSRQLGMNIGDFAENMLSSLELRIKKAYEVAGIDPAHHDCDELFIRVILLADKGGLAEANIHREFEEIGRTAKDNEWTPEVKI